MPITVTELENRIFLLKWDGNVTMDEIKQSHEETYLISQEKGFNAYVHILDGETLESYPFDLPALWDILGIHPEAFAVLLINMPVAGITLARMLNRLTTRVTLQDFRTVHDAIAGAQRLLDKRRAQVIGW